MRRRQRRLRSWWRHEQQSKAAALATALIHSAQHPVPKKQEWEDAEYVAGQKIDTRAHGGLRPALLAEAAWGGTGSAAHRGPDRRRSPSGASSRRSCAADGGHSS